MQRIQQHTGLPEKESFPVFPSTGAGQATAFYVLLTFLTEPSPSLRLLSLSYQQEDVFTSASL